MSVTAAICCWSAQADAAPSATMTWYEDQPPVSGAEYGGGTIKFDSSGNVLLTSAYASTVTKFNPTGTVVGSYIVGGMTQCGRMIVDSSNNVYINGTASDTSRSYMAVSKLNSSLHVVWTKKYDLGPVSEHMTGGPMAMGSNGSLYVIGRSGNQSQATAPVTLFQLDTNGNVTHSKAMGASPDGQTGLNNSVLAVDSSNNVYYADPRGIRKLASDLQSDKWPKAQPLIVRALAFHGSNVYVTGTATVRSLWYMHVSSLNPTTGTVTWQYSFWPVYQNDFYSASGQDNTFGGNAITTDGSGNVYAAGAAGNSNDGFIGGTVAKFTSAGHLSWSNEIGWSGSSATCADLALDSKADVYTACTDQQLGNGTSTATDVIYDSSGNEKLYLSNDGPGGQDDIFDHVLVGSSGNLFLLDEAGTWATDGSGQMYVEPWIFHYSVTGL